MKTIKILSSVFILALAITVSAVEKPTMNAIPISSEKALIAISNENPASFEVSITSANGDLVYYNKTKNKVTDFKKIFNFSNLNNGNYTLTLKVNDTSLTKRLTVSKKGITTGDSKLAYDPYFNFKDNALKFSFINFDEKFIIMHIYSNDGLVYTKKLGNDLSITGGLDLSKLEKGNYRIELNSENSNYSFNLEK